MTTVLLVEAACSVCGQALADGEPCDVCSVALRDGLTIEEVRLEIEDLARSMTARFASAEGRPCTCGAGPSCVPLPGPKLRGCGGRLMGYVTFDVHHADGCPRAPEPFDWPDVDEAERLRVFGYEGRRAHAARLVDVLRQERDWRAGP